MFLCKGCIHPDDKWRVDIWPSRGPCEKCGYMEICVDTKSPIDPDWEENLKKRLEND